MQSMQKKMELVSPITEIDAKEHEVQMQNVNLMKVML
jgi:hypothetical protein